MGRTAALGFVAALAMVAFAGCGTETVNGRLVDGMTGDPVAGTPEADSALKLVLRAKDRVSVTCQAFEATIQADGTFTLPGVCTNETAYSVSLNDKSWWPADIDGLAHGPTGGATWDVKVWRAPAGSGIYKLAGGQLEVLKTVADVKKDKVLGGEEVIRSPSTMPADPVRIAPGEFFVVAGPDDVKKMEFHPLIPSGERMFGDPKDPKVVQPWSYIGVKFASDTEFERVAAKIDKSKTLLKEQGDRSVLFVPGDALPAGRYAVLKANDRRTCIIDFGRPGGPAGGEGGKVEDVADAGKDGKAGKAGKAGKSP